MNRLKSLLPTLAAAVTLLTACLLPNAAEHPAASRPYFSILLAVVLILTLAAFLAGLAFPEFGKRYTAKSPFRRYPRVPVYSQYFDREDGNASGTLFPFARPGVRRFIRRYRFSWQVPAVFPAFAAYRLDLRRRRRFPHRIAFGFNRHARYWIQPLVRVLGPIPSTAWIPLVLVSFPTVVSASAFLIALAVLVPDLGPDLQRHRQHPELLF